MAKHISLPDLPSSDLLTHFPECVQFITDCTQDGGTVLVHCEHGISRSATVVLAYLMKKQRSTLLKTLSFLRDRKPDIRPNAGFLEQLKLWEMMYYKLDNTCKQYRAYVLYHQAQSMKRNGYMESMDLSPNPVRNQQDKTYLYKCKKCRYILLCGDSIIQHELGSGESAFPNKHRHSNTDYFTVGDTRNRGHTHRDESEPTHNRDDPPDNPSNKSSGSLPDSPSDNSPTSPDFVLDGDSLEDGNHQSNNGKDKSNVIGGTGEEIENDSSRSLAHTDDLGPMLQELADLRIKVSSLQKDVTHDDHSSCSSLFVEPVEWMGPFLLGHKDGKLLCPKCSSRVGSFDWSGTQCSCGKWVCPAFKIVKSKIDASY